MHAIVVAEIIGAANAQHSCTTAQQQAYPAVETCDIQRSKQEKAGDHGPSGKEDILSFEAFKLDRGVYPPVGGINSWHTPALKSIEGFQYGGRYHEKDAAGKPEGDLPAYLMPVFPGDYLDSTDQPYDSANRIHQLGCCIKITSHHGIGLAKTVVAVSRLGIQ